MKTLPDIVHLPPGDASVAPVRILDADGSVVRVVSAEEFRRMHPRQAPWASAPNSRRPRAH